MPSEVDLGSQSLTLQVAIITDLQLFISNIKETQKSNQSHTYPLMKEGDNKRPSMDQGQGQHIVLRKTVICAQYWWLSATSTQS